MKSQSWKGLFKLVCSCPRFTDEKTEVYLSLVVVLKKICHYFPVHVLSFSLERYVSPELGGQGCGKSSPQNLVNAFTAHWKVFTSGPKDIRGRIKVFVSNHGNKVTFTRVKSVFSRSLSVRLTCSKL